MINERKIDMNKETNLEHYKEKLKNILRNYYYDFAVAYKHIRDEIDKDIDESGSISKTRLIYYSDAILEWMPEPYKGPILDDVEKEYLSAVIKPFRKRIDYICKMSGDTDVEYILISTKDNDRACLPYFLGNTMYKRMESMKRYTLEELGL